MTSRAALLLALVAAACVDEVKDPRSGQVDFSDPKSVVGSIFYAAETGHTEHLRGLCDPDGAGDGDTGRICAMKPGAADWDSFRQNFASAHLNGEPRVSGNRARLDFVFGPGASRSETMELVRRGERWYLASF